MAKSKTGKKKTALTKVNKLEQKKLSTKAKKSALKFAGKTTHVMAHTRAATQRQQARRDGKNK